MLRVVFLSAGRRTVQSRRGVLRLFQGFDGPGCCVQNAVHGSFAENRSVHPSAPRTMPAILSIKHRRVYLAAISRVGRREAGLSLSLRCSSRSISIDCAISRANKYQCCCRTPVLRAKSTFSDRDRINKPRRRGIWNSSDPAGGGEGGQRERRLLEILRDSSRHFSAQVRILVVDPA